MTAANRAYAALLIFVGACASSVAGDEFDAIDTDHNGTVSQEEAQAAGRAVFNSIDRNGDGKLSNDDVQSRIAPQVLKAADPDADGALNPEEYSALVTARVKSANTNGDGAVDREEIGTLAGKLLQELIDEEPFAN
jgi:Ca2+-binding EF-hand superfamily protein